MCGSLFYNKGAGFMDKVKLSRSHFTRHRCFPVKFAKFLTTPLRTPTILQNICEIGDDFFYGSKVHSLLIPSSKESMKVKESIKYQPVRCMCRVDTCVSLEIRDEQILQFSLQLTDTIGAKKLYANQRYPLFQTLGKINLIFENLILLYLYLRQSR